MTATILETLINNEIDKINDRIDMKIEHGLSYTRDALMHRKLVNRLSRVRAARKRRMSGADLLTV